ncbi:MAG: Na(+)-translocating NADH-quinone reductase subunit C [Psychromonas sp.]|nr:Na(+)-translocating NADH-quinone reductase subunit C [Psychromonas sp.]
MSNKKDTFFSTILVVLIVCLVCSIVVSSAAVGLRSMQKANKIADTQKNILAVAGVSSNKTMKEIFATNIKAKLVNLKTGKFVEGGNVATYEQRHEAKIPGKSIKLTAKEDVAKIGRRANIAKIYLVSDDHGKLQRIILPIHGAGLWSTMYAFVALKPDGSTVMGIAYYDQAETPGLGGEVTNPRWTSLWIGKQLFNKQGDVAIKVIKGHAPKNAVHEVDGLAGATLTSDGVENTFLFWLGKNGFGPFLSNVRAGVLNHD